MKKIIHLLSCYSLFIIHSFCFSQNEKIDSLLSLLKKDKEDTSKVIHLNKLCGAYANTNRYDTALHYVHQALQLAIKINYNYGIASSYYHIGNIFTNQGGYDKALEKFAAALKIQKEIGDKKGIANSF